MPYVVCANVHNPNVDAQTATVTVTETNFIPPHLEENPLHNETYQITAYPSPTDSAFCAIYQHDWHWLWLEEDTNSYLTNAGKDVIDYFGISADMVKEGNSLKQINANTRLLKHLMISQNLRTLYRKLLKKASFLALITWLNMNIHLVLPMSLEQ